jgi:hypothetical protein
MGAPGTRPVVGRAGATRGGMGAPGTDEVPTAAGAGPGATRCVGTCGDFGGSGGAGVGCDAAESSAPTGGVDGGGAVGMDVDPGRLARAGGSGVCGRAGPGNGCRGPLGTTPPAEDPGIGRGAGRAGTEMGRFPGPELAG